MPRQITALATTVINDDGAGEWLYAACADGSVWYCPPAKPGWYQLPSIPDPKPPIAQAPAPTPPQKDLELEALMEAHGGYWGSHPDYPFRDWASEAKDDQTRLGYWEWVESKLLAKAEDEEEDDEQSAGTPVQAVSPTNKEISGSLERLHGCAYGGFTRKPDGTIEFAPAGETNVYWDGQETIIRDGEAVYVDAVGDEWKFSQLIFHD